MRVFYQKIMRYYRSLSRTKKIAALSTIGVLLVSLCAGGWVLLGEEKTVTVDIDGTTQTYTTYTHNVAELLNSENIILDSRDKVEPAL
ncbi:MAG: ubiquitin-like domain-containing protein, partial [Bacillota bacterium]|nr:ubiquitin-like domain-containing protein [Bacillota bacterium]